MIQLTLQLHFHYEKNGYNVMVSNFTNFNKMNNPLSIFIKPSTYVDKIYAWDKHKKVRWNPNLPPGNWISNGYKQT